LLIQLLLWVFQSFRPVFAAPHFSISGTTSGEFGIPHTWLLKLHASGSLLTAAQTVINFDNSMWAVSQLSNLESKCSFWGPPDPSLGLGNLTTPYFYNYEKIVVSCGFSNPGYVTAWDKEEEGDLILAFTLFPYFVGTDEITFSDSSYRYIDQTIAAGTDVGLTFESAATISATVTVSADLSTAPTATPTPVPIDTLNASDLQLQDYSAYFKSLKQRIGADAYNMLTQGLGLVPLDNTVPPPPTDMEKRASATPRPTSEQNSQDGEVLSLQSLRELLIPGKSDADKRLVIFNLIAMLTFLILLAVLIWRLVVSSRINKIRYRHMKEMVEGEISVIQSKLEGIRSGATNEEVLQSLDDLRRELEKQK
jgi:hypothetical protein